MNEQEKAHQAAKAEPTINEQDLLTELKEAIQDYFIAQADKEGDGLRLQFPNNQQFLLLVKAL